MAVVHTKRIYELDMSKGILVLLVILVHLITPVTDYIRMDVVFAPILTIFFWISGYFSKSDTIAVQEIKRFKAIFLPMLFAFLIFFGVYLAYVLWHHKFSAINVVQSIVGAFGGEKLATVVTGQPYHKDELHRLTTTFWFFTQLILANAVLIPIQHFVLESRKKTFVASAILFSISIACYLYCDNWVLNLQITPAVVAFMLLGAYCGKIGLVEKWSGFSNGMCFVMAFLSFSCNILVSSYFDRLTFLSSGWFGNRGVFSLMAAILQTALGIITILSLCRILGKIRFLRDTLSWLGVHSLQFMLAHMGVAWILCQATGLPLALDYVRGNEEITTKSVLEMAVVFVLTMAICSLICILQDRRKRNKAQTDAM